MSASSIHQTLLEKTNLLKVVDSVLYKSPQTVVNLLKATFASLAACYCCAGAAVKCLLRKHAEQEAGSPEGLPQRGSENDNSGSGVEKVPVQLKDWPLFKCHLDLSLKRRQSLWRDILS